MALIKVICGGCGIHYTDAHGNARHALKTPESGPFECDDAQAARLIHLGVAAVYVEGIGWQQVEELRPQPDEQTDVAQVDEQQEEQDDGTQETEKATGHLDAEQLTTMTNEQLKNLAGDLGVDVTGCKKKADYIAAIVAYEVSIPDEDEDDGDELPELSAADPE